MSTTTAAPAPSATNCEFQFPAKNPVILVDVGSIIDGTAGALKAGIAKAMDPDLHARLRKGAFQAGKALGVAALAVGAAMASTGGIPTKDAPTKLLGYFG